MADFTEYQLRGKLRAFDSNEGLKNLVKNCDEEMLIMGRQKDKDWVRIKFDANKHRQIISILMQNEEELVTEYLQATDADRSSLETKIKEKRDEFDGHLRSLENAYTRMEKHLIKLGYSGLREQGCAKNKDVAVALHAQDELETKIKNRELDPADPKVYEEKTEADRVAIGFVGEHVNSVRAARIAQQRKERKKRKLGEEEEES